ncbi:VWA domain-containing protein [Actinoplanes sp. NBRC 103695]|uniref:VWA domain-containing protein n=1 Tax=Actinoplanes sp. NBRC 103695 TaxID=3032202 RepID=UPI0024A2CFCF|nr:VWA domain-containing protein [Actinoplanes sp. NBRC 103695]GLZ01679.1 VWA domain-containing protein [Actinoplanes sp. NBRC 103695]
MSERDDQTRGERQRRWRLVLGGPADDALGEADGRDGQMDAALAALYDAAAGDDEGGEQKSRRSAGLGGSAPRVARWLGDIREFFPSTVVQVMQADAIERLDLHRLLMEPEMLQAVEPDVHLVGTLLSLNRVMPDQTKAAARHVVRTVVDDLEKRIAQHTRAAVTGALNRASRTTRPRPADIDWDRTIRANLKHYQAEQRTVIPERLIGYGRRSHAVQRDVILCVDQSGSMASSVVFAGVFAAVLASIRSLRTSLVVFDTSVVDLTDQLSDPVEVLFGTQLGGGTDINRAVAYAQQLITNPRDSVFVLISDLYEGGVRQQMLRRVAEMTAAGVQVVVLLALSDEGAPSYDRENAAALAALGVPAFACTPDAFPELMAAAIQRRDLQSFAERFADR